MATTIENKSRLMEQLICSCYRSEADFRSAAESVRDSSLKRLFEIYAQQRTRFAAELLEHLHPAGEQEDDFICDADSDKGEQTDWLRNCLDTESRTLQLYKQALAKRSLPTRTHFLVSSQLALMQGAHARVCGLAGGSKSHIPESPVARV